MAKQIFIRSGFRKGERQRVSVRVRVRVSVRVSVRVRVRARVRVSVLRCRARHGPGSSPSGCEGVSVPPGASDGTISLRIHA